MRSVISGAVWSSCLNFLLTPAKQRPRCLVAAQLHPAPANLLEQEASPPHRDRRPPPGARDGESSQGPVTRSGSRARARSTAVRLRGVGVRVVGQVRLIALMIVVFLLLIVALRSFPSTPVGAGPALIGRRPSLAVPEGHPSPTASASASVAPSAGPRAQTESDEGTEPEAYR